MATDAASADAGPGVVVLALMCCCADAVGAGANAGDQPNAAQAEPDGAMNVHPPYFP